MRRGLMAWDADEVPVEALRPRIRRRQGELASADRDAIILYTNFIRSAAVSYLTAFSPYWADGLLLVPREGEPVFATTLSKRGMPCIRSPAASQRGCISASTLASQLNDFGPAIVRSCHSPFP